MDRSSAIITAARLRMETLPWRIIQGRKRQGRRQHHVGTMGRVDWLNEINFSRLRVDARYDCYADRSVTLCRAPTITIARTLLVATTATLATTTIVCCYYHGQRTFW